MATAPQYAVVPRSNAILINTANTDRTGANTTGMVTLITGAANGTRVDDLVMKARGNTTASIIRMFLFDGVAYHLLEEYIVTTVTASSTVPSWSQPQKNLSIILESGHSLAFTTETAQAFTIAITRGGDF